VYLRVSSPLAGQAAGITPDVSFIGEMSPPIMLLAVPAVIFFLVRLVFRRPALGGRDAGGAAAALGDVQMSILGTAWFLATWVPYELQQVLDNRISYTYYMIVVMPGIYVAVIHLVTLGFRRGRRWLQGLIVAWALLVLAAVIVMYPFLAVF
jgi:hypothetical protein